MPNNSGTSIISKPTGGGALQGLGEKFSPDLFTGTGNFSIPITVPPGRNGLQPQLGLQYSTGNGNSPFGLGWGISVPNVSRKTSRGIPIYNNEKDVFILSGAEDLVVVETGLDFVRYQPRTEGLFAKIYHYKNTGNDYWKVMTKDGLVSFYGTPNSAGNDSATVHNPDNPSNVFSWHLTRTEDLFGNHIIYKYDKKQDQQDNRNWTQIYLSEIKYMDYGDSLNPDYLLSIKFNYEERTDAFSSFRQGFEIRTTQRCTNIEVFTHDTPNTLIRQYDLIYLDEQVTKGELPNSVLPLNGMSLLSQVKVTGFKNGETESMPPISFNYTNFQPQEHDLIRMTGRDLPPGSLARPEYELADLFGNGLPDYLEMGGGVIRYWRNLGNGKFDMPRNMKDAPAGLNLGNQDVQMIDSNGDARVDLMVNANGLSGYFSTEFGADWDRRSFKKYKEAPSFSFQDPEVKLVDLNGDGITDAIRSGSRLECFFHDADEGWNDTKQIGRRQLDEFPNINFSDSRVRWADMSGDGMQDIVLVYDRNIEYWANMGYGNFSKKISMRNSPRLPFRYDPKRLLIGDVDGDGLADIIYVENNKIILWLNQSGNAWSEPIEISGTPPVSDIDAVRIEDMLGRGVGGVLWSMDKGGLMRHHLYFLDLTKGVKPYLLHETNNLMGAITRVEYKSSIEYYLQDELRPQTRWKTTLPFPVQTVACVEVIDEISKGKLTTEYNYHHGYWDGGEREFRGFGRVDQRDTESFERFNSNGLHDNQQFISVEEKHYAPPTETRTWFHLGAVGDEHGEWTSPEFTNEYWQGDINVFPTLDDLANLLKSLPRRAKRDAFRALRGNILRSELFALDGSPRQDRPYTVTEGQFSVQFKFAPPDEKIRGEKHIFFPFGVGQRTTQWERGDDPMTQLSFTADYDDYGQPKSQVSIAVPRGRKYSKDNNSFTKSYFATFATTTFCNPKDSASKYIVGRVAKAKTFEIINDGKTNAFQLKDDILNGNATYQLLGQAMTFYDGNAFEGLPFKEIGEYGLPVRTESLVLNDAIIQAAYPNGMPSYLNPNGTTWNAEYPTDFQNNLPPLTGYKFYDKNTNPEYTTGWYAVGARTKFDFQNGVVQPKGLALTTRDPFDNETNIQFDTYDFLPKKVIDPQGMTVEAEYDYATLQVKKMTDPNGNQSEFAYSPLGLLQKAAVMGKPGENNGDTLDDPGIEYQYDFFVFKNNGNPVWSKTITRENHINDNINNNTIQSIQYSDGFGRLLQTRVQAEDVLFGNNLFGDAGLPTDQSEPNAPAIGIERTANAPLNVIVNGWQVYNNKGWVVEQFEPYYDQGWDYDPVSSGVGQKVQLFYDPRGNTIRTVNPDQTEQRVIFGKINDLTQPDDYIPTPWENYSYDANDLAPITHTLDQTVPANHHFTPTSIEVDGLGRTIRSTNHNAQDDGNGNMEDVVMQYRYDIRGNLLAAIDPYNRIAFSHVYDFANNALQTSHLDGGIKTVVFNGIGNPIELRDQKGSLILNAFDNLNRPIKTWARDNQTETVTLRQQIIYGDAAGLPNPKDKNLLGKPYKSYDEAGLVMLPECDFKGNPLVKIRQVIKDSEIIKGTIGNAYRVDWTANDLTTREAELLDSKIFQTNLSYDALGRTVQLTYPEDVKGERKIVTPTYNRAGALQSIELKSPLHGITKGVEHIAYNVKGQRILVAHGNGIMTRYAYDDTTFRLARMRSEKFTKKGWTYSHQSGSTRQDYAYTYDLLGNIIAINDKTPQSGIGGTNELLRQFSYDPLNRLLSANGREADKPKNTPPWLESTPHQDPNLTRAYTRKYTYDKLGNIQQLKHDTTSSPNYFTRNFEYKPNQNILYKINIGNAVSNDYAFQYDVNGNQIQEANSRFFEWDNVDQLRAFYIKDTNNVTLHAQYLYAGGQRLKKVVQKSTGELEVTIYIDGIFEYQYHQKANDFIENNTLHLMDSRIRVATLRVGTPFPSDMTPDLKYNLDDHLGNASVTLTENGGWVSREEYFPFGETSFGSFSKKRYRFVGKEKDEESGLYYYGARYYAVWTCRFVSIDPLFRDYPFYTPYQYAGNQPIIAIDLDGEEPSYRIQSKARSSELKPLLEEYNNLVNSFRQKSTFEKFSVSSQEELNQIRSSFNQIITRLDEISNESFKNLDDIQWLENMYSISGLGSLERKQQYNLYFNDSGGGVYLSPPYVGKKYSPVKNSSNTVNVSLTIENEDGGLWEQKNYSIHALIGTYYTPPELKKEISAFSQWLEDAGEWALEKTFHFTTNIFPPTAGAYMIGESITGNAYDSYDGIARPLSLGESFEKFFGGIFNFAASGSGSSFTILKQMFKNTIKETDRKNDEEYKKQNPE